LLLYWLENKEMNVAAHVRKGPHKQNAQALERTNARAKISELTVTRLDIFDILIQFTNLTIRCVQYAEGKRNKK
jgi:hypothetical protein